MGYTPSSCRYVKIDPYNGVVIGTVLDGTDTAAALLAADGSMLNASLLLLKTCPRTVPCATQGRFTGTAAH